MIGPIFQKLSEEHGGLIDFCKVDADEQPDVLQEVSVHSVRIIIFLFLRRIR